MISAYIFPENDGDENMVFLKDGIRIFMPEFPKHFHFFPSNLLILVKEVSGTRFLNPQQCEELYYKVQYLSQTLSSPLGMIQTQTSEL